jgi:hypothetical protein
VLPTSTITLWALILLFICNRFFVHFAIHLNKNESVTPKQVGDVLIGSEVGSRNATWERQGELNGR